MYQPPKRKHRRGVVGDASSPSGCRIVSHAPFSSRRFSRSPSPPSSGSPFSIRPSSLPASSLSQPLPFSECGFRDVMKFYEAALAPSAVPGAGGTSRCPCDFRGVRLLLCLRRVGMIRPSSLGSLYRPSSPIIAFVDIFSHVSLLGLYLELAPITVDLVRAVRGDRGLCVYAWNAL